jgi:hypothetical protein
LQDRDPAQAGLKAFQADLLEQALVVRNREAPFLVVVAAVDLFGIAHQQRATPSGPSTTPRVFAM